jgi:hypothetical protein
VRTIGAKSSGTNSLTQTKRLRSWPSATICIKALRWLKRPSTTAQAIRRSPDPRSEAQSVSGNFT